MYAGTAPAVVRYAASVGIVRRVVPPRVVVVAFGATVYGGGVGNLVLLPLATRLRGLARHGALEREIIIDGMVALQEGLHPRLLEQKLYGYLPPASPRKRQAAGVRA